MALWLLALLLRHYLLERCSDRQEAAQLQLGLHRCLCWPPAQQLALALALAVALALALAMALAMALAVALAVALAMALAVALAMALAADRALVCTCCVT